MTGLPALSLPAGFTADGLPIGVELLGLALSDANLVALAYDYEQSVHPRRAPSTTPPLVYGRAPIPIAYGAVARSGSVVATGRFTFDATRRMLSYDVRVVGAAAGQLYAVSLATDSTGRPGPIVRRLVAQGMTRARGAAVVGAAARRELLEGRMALVLFLRDHVGDGVRAPLVAQRVKTRP